MPKRQNSVYGNIAADIKSKIEAGELRPGQKLMSERDMMQRYCVQRTTVRRALDVLSDEGVIIKLAGVGSVVNDGRALEQKKPAGDVADTAKQCEKTVQAMRMGKIVFCYPDSVIFRRREKTNAALVCSSLKSKCQSAGFEFEVCERVSQLKESGLNNADTVVFCERIDAETMAQMEDNNIPFVMLFGQQNDTFCVGLDIQDAVKIAVNELYEKGHRKIGFVGSDEEFFNERTQRLSFEGACRELGISTEFINAGGSDLQSGYLRTRELVRSSREPVTAIMAVNDDAAQGAVKALEEISKRVPYDVSVVGFGAQNKNTDLASLYFDIDNIASELFRAVCYAAGNKPYGCSCRISAELVGETVAVNTRASNRGSISDFLL